MRRTDPSLLDAAARVGGSVLGMLQHRLQLAGIEISEARERFVGAIVTGLAAVLLLAGAVVALTAWVAVAAWPVVGPAVLGGIALLYGGAGIGLLGWLRARLQAEPPLLADTLAELRADTAMARGEGLP